MPGFMNFNTVNKLSILKSSKYMLWIINFHRWILFSSWIWLNFLWFLDLYFHLLWLVLVMILTIMLLTKMQTKMMLNFLQVEQNIRKLILMLWKILVLQTHGIGRLFWFCLCMLRFIYCRLCIYADSYFNRLSLPQPYFFVPLYLFSNILFKNMYSTKLVEHSCYQF